MKVLVIAGSKHGGTAEIAGTIGERLRSSGLEVTVSTPDDHVDVADYDAAVVGSAVYLGHWTKATTRFVERNKRPLSDRPVWLFSSGPVGNGADGQTPEGTRLSDDLGARGHEIFAGRLDRTRLNLAERAAVRAAHASYGDFRDWPHVQEWADHIAAELVWDRRT